MSLLPTMQLLTRSTLMDTNHRNTNRPRGRSDAQAQIPIVGIDVTAFLEGPDDLDDGDEEGVLHIALLKFAKQLAPSA